MSPCFIKVQEGNRITIKLDEKTLHTWPSPMSPSSSRLPGALQQVSKVANGLISSSRCQPLHSQPPDAESVVVGNGSRGFYGGSLLKVRSRRSLSGDFLPKREKRHLERRSVRVLSCDSLSEERWRKKSGWRAETFLDGAEAGGS